MTSCQLVVLASDSLLTPQVHTQQARINLHIAPQLVGRSINFEHHHHHPHQTGNGDATSSDSNAKLFNSRSLVDQHNNLPGGADWSAGTFGGGRPSNQQVFSRSGGESLTPSSQRSSVATVMSSLQHMVRSVNFFDMPMSSALLLSALLAFLICLLLIVLISMSVHIYRRRMKVRHRRHLASTAHLRHAHMAAQLHHKQRTTAPGNGSEPQQATSNGSRYLVNGGRNGSGSSCSSTPTHSTAAGPAASSPNYTTASNNTTAASPYHQSTDPTQSQQQTTDQQQQDNGQARMEAAYQQGGKQKRTTKPNSRPNSSNATRSSAGSIITGRPGSRQSAANTRNDSDLRASMMSPVGSGRESSASGSQTTRLMGGQCASAAAAIGAPSMVQHTQKLAKDQNNNENSLISSLSSHSKRSYRSNYTTDDSSVMHCGHYSVTASRSPHQRLMSPTGELPREAALGSLQMEQQQQPSKSLTGSIKLNTSQRQSSIEAAIKSLVSQKDNDDETLGEDEGDDDDDDGGGQPRINNQITRTRDTRSAAVKRANYRDSDSSPKAKSANLAELSVLTNSKPGIKSYRKLPLSAGSLVRPIRHNRVEPAASSDHTQTHVLMKRAASEQSSAATHDSAIASDASGSSAGSNSNNNPQQQNPREGLMAMIRDPDLRKRPMSMVPEVQHQNAPENSLLEEPNGIRWPEGVIPHRVKRLTWEDDDMNFSPGNNAQQQQQHFNPQLQDSDCYVAPDVQLSADFIGSPLSANHQYPIQVNNQSEQPYLNHQRSIDNHDGGTQNDQHFAEQHFLFSNPCSPTLNLTSNDFMSLRMNQQAAAAAAAAAEQQQLVTSVNKLPYSPTGCSIDNHDNHHQSISLHMGQNNCLDYTIVQSSQFHVDSFASERLEHKQQQQQSLSAQHHLLQLRAQQLAATKNRPMVSPYLYNSNSFSADQAVQRKVVGSPSPTSIVAAVNNTNHHQDLRPMTTAVL